MLFKSYTVLKKQQFILAAGDDAEVTFRKHVACSLPIWSRSFATFAKAVDFEENQSASFVFHVSHEIF